MDIVFLCTCLLFSFNISLTVRISVGLFIQVIWQPCIQYTPNMEIVLTKTRQTKGTTAGYSSAERCKFNLLIIINYNKFVQLKSLTIQNTVLQVYTFTAILAQSSKSYNKISSLSTLMLVN